MNRRGFIGALSGLPIAAVVQPRIAAPEVSTPPPPIVSELQQPQITINIMAQRPLTARDRDELARLIGDSVTRRLRSSMPRLRT